MLLEFILKAYYDRTYNECGLFVFLMRPFSTVYECGAHKHAQS